MSFILPSTLEESLGLADDICAILYTMYHDKDLVVGLWGYHNNEYTVSIGDTRMKPPPPRTRELLFDSYFSVLSDEVQTNNSLLYSSTIYSGAYETCVLSYKIEDGFVKVRNSSATGMDTNQIQYEDMSYQSYPDLSKWTEEYYFQESLLHTDWELVSFILLSTLRHEKILSARVDIGHMCVIIQESPKERMQAVREFYAHRDKSLSSPLFESENVQS